jgi:hypothetical protein
MTAPVLPHFGNYLAITKVNEKLEGNKMFRLPGLGSNLK